jgi:shikimate dehydrogenase
MHPNIYDSALSPDLLNKGMLVMDVVYNPLETKLLKDAREKGCTTIDGLSMFLH